MATTIPITLNQGDVYSVFGTVVGTRGTDLSGSKVRSISTAGSVGCKKIAHIRGPVNPQNAIDRFLGYKKALEKNQIPFDKNLV